MSTPVLAVSASTAAGRTSLSVSSAVMSVTAVAMAPQAVLASKLTKMLVSMAARAVTPQRRRAGGAARAAGTLARGVARRATVQLPDWWEIMLSKRACGEGAGIARRTSMAAINKTRCQGTTLPKITLIYIYQCIVRYRTRARDVKQRTAQTRLSILLSETCEPLQSAGDVQIKVVYAT